MMATIEDVMALRDPSNPFRAGILADWAAAYILRLPMIKIVVTPEDL